MRFSRFLRYGYSREVIIQRPQNAPTDQLQDFDEMFKNLHARCTISIK